MPPLEAIVRPLFPESVVVAVRKITDQSGELHPAEADWIKDAAPSRQAEFYAGRRCAHVALASFGHENFPLLPDENRAPRWPDSLVGSLAHTVDFCVVVVGRREEVGSLGLDVESKNRVTEKLWSKILTAHELTWLEAQPERKRAEFATLIFSAKEAFYKFQYPLTRQWLGFQDVAIAPECHGTKFMVELLRPCPPLGSKGWKMAGSCAQTENLLVTALSGRGKTGMRAG